ncbi:MAG: 1-acyl-sn-glycerol-3-phosphate acyltransferase [Bacteroidetes bacterium HGW-Bacteroidetes-17]|jgi:1-acyl-sn-glycerol-3-phosphate acyltransferase|nr:MAG: 1-acyl-sn-glycerol-3-phosphate acyltransferase [Bacteroidetes bacterium HGW-Bacteroidetes-17]
MKLILSHILTPVYFVVFGFLVVIFQPIQIICRNFWGYQSHKTSVDILNLWLFKSLKIVGARIIIEGSFDFPTNRPLIIVANHQSTYDIPAIYWLFRKNHPKFIAKKELGKYIPSISYNLRHSGAAIIDRKNPTQAIKEIIKLGRLIESKNYSACIFPEGTRSRTGKLRSFQSGGIKTLLKVSPSALIVPFAINGNHKLHQYGKYPLSFGETLKFTALEPIEPNQIPAEELVLKIEQEISKIIGD